MERATFDLLAEPTGDLYHQLLQFAVGECGIAVLVVHKTPPLSDYGALVMSQLERFLASMKESREWPGTEIGPLGAPASVFRYNYEVECAAILQRATNRLYGWMQPGLPEDLCLLRDDDSPWLVTLVHDHDGYLCLSSEERNRLVQALPRIASRLRDSRCREETFGLERDVTRFLVAWDPYGWYGGSPEDESVIEAQAIVYALRSGDVRAEAELATYIADMFDRWYGTYASFTAEECSGIAHTIWAWWEQRQRLSHT